MSDKYDAAGFPLGDCFLESVKILEGTHPEFQEVLSEEAVVVHGLPRLQRPPYAHYCHAWVEDGRWVYTPRLEDILTVPVDLFYRVGRIALESCRRYTYSEVNTLLAANKHFGPWDPDLIAFRDGEPEVVAGQDR